VFTDVVIWLVSSRVVMAWREVVVVVWCGHVVTSSWLLPASTGQFCSIIYLTAVVYTADGLWQLHSEFLYVSLCSFYLLGSPVAITQRTSPYVLLLFLSFFFNARSLRSLSRSPRNFATWLEMGAILKTRSKICGPPVKKFGGRKTCFFGAISDDFALTIANISGMEQNIDSQKMTLQTTTSPASADVIWWTLVHKRQKIRLVCAYPIAST